MNFLFPYWQMKTHHPFFNYFWRMGPKAIWGENYDGFI